MLIRRVLDCLTRTRLPAWQGLLALVPFLLLGAPSSAQAKGTPAGTVIAHQVQLQFSSKSVTDLQTTSNAVQFVVQELIDVAVQWLDASAVATGSPDLSVPLTFQVTNLGNAPEGFRLERAALSSSGDFAPAAAVVGSLFIENGLQAGFQATGPNADTRYVAGVNDLNLAADAVATVYLVSDFPASLGTGAQGRAALRAISLTPGAAGTAPGKQITLPGGSAAGAVVGASGAMGEVAGAYLVTGLRLVMTKAQVAVRAGNGGTELVPGAECDYQIEVLLQGSSGQADDVVIDDPLPAQLRYVGNTLKLNGVPKSDASDADEGQVSADRITVRLGRMLPNQKHTITYTTRLQ